MKLRNKKTGRIYEPPIHCLCGKDYETLAEICEEWEDYEEPKAYWYLSGKGEVRCIEDEDTDFDKEHKLIGNYFETKEEAEKAVEKLKAWKRLKDARFEFGTIKYDLDEELSSTIAYDGIITIKGIAYEDFVDDLDLLFGAKDE